MQPEDNNKCTYNIVVDHLFKTESGMHCVSTNQCQTLMSVIGLEATMTLGAVLEYIQVYHTSRFNR